VASLFHLLHNKIDIYSSWPAVLGDSDKCINFKREAKEGKEGERKKGRKGGRKGGRNASNEKDY
jgi:hypothetical protein